MGERCSSPAASGYAGALAARILHRHPHFELAAVTSRSDVGASAERPVSAPPRRRSCSRSSTSTATATSTRRSSPTRTARRRRVVAELRGRGVRVVDLSADFRLRDRATYEELVRRARGAGAVRHRRLRAARALPRGDRRRRPRRRPRAASRPRRCSASRRSAARACRRRRHRREDRRLRRRARGDRRRRTSSASTRTSRPTGSAGHRHIAGDRPGAARRSARPSRRRSSRTCCRSTRASCSPATSRRRGASSQPELVERYAAAYADEPFVELADRAARRARRARDEPLPHPRPRRAQRTGKVLRLRRDRQPLEGRVLAGGAEPEPHVRPAETEGLGPLAEPAGVLA